MYFTPKCDVVVSKVQSNRKRNVVMYMVVMASHFLESMSVVLATARVPTREEQPPLADLFLDYVSYRHWCGRMAELSIVFIGFHILFINLTHKFGSLMFQRFCQCVSVVTLLRTVFTLMTSLSIPGKYTNCERQPITGFLDLMDKTYKVYTGMGLSLFGVHSCGDFMFSGHTAQVTAFCFFVREYTHWKHHRYLHVYSWMINVLTMVFILAAQKHYTIDVVFAFIVTSFTISQYHQIVGDFRKTSVAYKKWGSIFVFLPYIENGDYRTALEKYNWQCPSFSKVLCWDRVFKNQRPKGLHALTLT